MKERADRVSDDPWWRAGLATVGLLFRASHRLRMEGLEHIPAEGPAILAANHVSPLDPIAMCLAAARRDRTVRFLGAAEVFDIPLIGWGVKRLRQIPIRRGGGDRAALEDAAGVIRAGALAGIFPEGKLGTGQDLLPAKRGMARLALAAGVPIIPIGVWGMQRRWPVGGIKLHPPVRPIAAVSIGPPIPVDGNPEVEEAVRGLTARTFARITELVKRARVIAGDPASQSEASASESPR